MNVTMVALQKSRILPTVSLLIAFLARYVYQTYQLATEAMQTAELSPSASPAFTVGHRLPNVSETGEITSPPNAFPA